MSAVATELDRLLIFGSYVDVESFVKSNPLCIQETCCDPQNYTPFHRVIHNPDYWSFLGEDLEIPPDHRIPDRVRKLQLLISEYPEGLSYRNDDGYTLLHDAVTAAGVHEHDESMQILGILLKAIPYASLIRDAWGLTPLESAIDVRDFEVARFLLRNHLGNDPAVCPISCYGCRPILHRALERRAPLDFVKMVLDRYPNDLTIKDSDGKLPLSVELCCAARLNIIRLLVDKYPDAASIADNNGLLPMHHAVSNKDTTNNTLDYLSKRNPDAITSVLLNGDTV